jgi:hypothetical protein
MLNKKLNDDELKFTQKEAVLAYSKVHKPGIYLEDDKPEYEARVVTIITHDFGVF